MPRKKNRTLKLYGTNEAAKYVGLTVPAFKYHIYNDNVEGQMIGNSLVFTQDELDRFKKEKRGPGRPPKNQIDKET